MEEKQDLQKFYGLMQMAVYVSVIVEIIMYVPFQELEKISFIIDRIGKFEIYNNLLYSKLVTLLLLFVTCIGTTSKKNIEFNPLKHVILPVGIGFIVFFGSVFIYSLKTSTLVFGITLTQFSYIIASFIGTVFINIGLDNISKALKSNLMKDRFNVENESFEQNRQKVENEYSINIPMKFYYNKKWNDGWLDISNPFRGCVLIGTPGSGKTFSVVNSYIKQHSRKAFSLVVYDYKYPALSEIAYYHYNMNLKRGRIPANTKYHVINFDDVEGSRRINPLSTKYIRRLSDAIETAQALVDSLLQKKQQGGGGSEEFFNQSAINFMACCIYFFSRYKNGIYSDLPHILSFLNRDYEDVFDVLFSHPELDSLLSPFVSAYKQKAFDQLEGQIGSLKIQISRLATKESFWIFTGDDFNLKVSDTNEPSYLIIANNPDTENINSSLNALVLNRLTRLVNSKGNNPVSIIIDELPTIYFHKIAALMATARSNRVSVLLGLQEIPQLKKLYGDNGAQEIISICGNILSGQARSKETLEWLQNDIFGKVKQIKEGLSFTQNKVTTSINETMDYLIPASKIADLPTGYLVGQIARDFKANSENENFETTRFFCKTQFDIKKIKKEESNYCNPPKYYNFGSEKDEILEKNFLKVKEEVSNMIKDVLN